MHNMIIEGQREHHSPLATVDHDALMDFADFLAMHAKI
jgi:hypothetical protein